MQKWTVDADDVRDIGEDLFHETPWISDFLAPDNRLSDSNGAILAVKELRLVPQ